MTPLSRYHKRRKLAAVPRWKQVAAMRARGMTLKQVGYHFGIAPSVVFKLEQKWHSYRIENGL